MTANFRRFDKKFPQSCQGARTNASNLTAAAVWLGFALALLFRLRVVCPFCHAPLVLAARATPSDSQLLPAPPSSSSHSAKHFLCVSWGCILLCYNRVRIWPLPSALFRMQLLWDLAWQPVGNCNCQLHLIRPVPGGLTLASHTREEPEHRAKAKKYGVKPNLR